MSATTCPTPGLCRVKTHVIGTASARVCAARVRAVAAMPPPPPPTAPAPVWDGAPSAIDVIEARVRADLAARDAACGWDPGSGAIHPTGGYDGREVTVTGQMVSVSHSLAGSTHRIDGPAQQRWGTDQEMDTQRWVRDGHLHREDGPASTSGKKGVTQYALEGSGPVGRSRSYAGMDRRLEDLVAAGAQRANVVRWLRVQDLVSDELAMQTSRTQALPGAEALVDSLVAAGASAPAAEGALEAKVPIDQLLEVAAGRLPISWALAATR